MPVKTVFFAAALVSASLSAARAAEPVTAPAPGAQGTVVLGDDSYQRVFLVFKTPVAVTTSGQTNTPLDRALKEPKPYASFLSALPPANWTSPEFNDVSWERWRAPVEVGPANEKHALPGRHIATANAMICLRGRFVVEDPARCRGVKLALEYVGGAVVYVNGQEVTRSNLPAGPLTEDTLADKYPDDLYCEPNGMFLQDSLILKNPAAFARRYRKLAGIEIPARLLKKGTNVLALELHRAPINEAVLDAKPTPMASMGGLRGIWAYVGLKGLQLTAAADDAIVAVAGRPRGVQLWNCTPFDTITAFDYGDGGEVLPVTIASPRNGVFSGRLVVSSDQPIRNLQVTAVDLVAEGGAKIPAAAVRVRCAEAAVPAKCWAPTHRFDGLLDAIPAEIPVVKVTPAREPYPRNYGVYKYCPEGPILISRNNQSGGAAAPLWLTVRVPRDAKPGTYRGTVSVSADGLKPMRVPLQVVVSAWVMPDPANFRIQNFAYLSEDAVARYYGVPLWSDKHFELMGKSMALMAEVNSRQALANLTINFYGGNKGAIDCSNEQTLIRWIKQADGTYKHDYALFDKYLDFVAKTIGKPSLLRLNCWGESIIKDGVLLPGGPGDAGKGITLPVSLLDPATGKVEPLPTPISGTPEHLAFWKPVLEEVRRKIEARGWWDVTAMGWNSYCYPPVPPVVENCRKIWPDGVWAYTAHNGTMGAKFPAMEKGVTMPVRFSDCVWTRGQPAPRGYRALFKPRPTVWCYTFRTDLRDWSDLLMPRTVPEEEILCGHDGVSDFGADLFPQKGDRGRFYCLGNGRGTGGPDDSTRALLAPGPDGAIATERFEMLREGVELAEAILFVQRALDDKKISGDLEQRANRLLDERDEAFLRHWSTGRFERDRKLLDLAGEVAGAAR